MRRLIVGVNRFLAESCGYLLMLVMFMTAGDALFRNLGLSVFGVVETAVFIVIAAVYFGLGHCEEEDGHVRVTALLGHLGPVPRQALRCLMALVTLSIMALATWACGNSALSSYESSDAVMANTVALYSWPARAAMAIGLFFYTCQTAFSLIDEAAKLRAAMAGISDQEEG